MQHGGNGGWRQLVSRGVFQSGLLRLARAASRSFELRREPRQRWPRLARLDGPKFVVLCYHRVGSGGVPLFSGLPPEVFAAQMKYLRRHYRLVSLDEICHELQSPTQPGPAVAVTFDDGYGDLCTHAFPILRQYRIPATIFLVVSSVESGCAPWYDRVFMALKCFPGDHLNVRLDAPASFHLSSPVERLRAAEKIVYWLRKQPDPRRREFCAALEQRVRIPEEELQGRMLTWEQVRDMQREGISFGSHTLTHPVISRLDAAEMERELCESKRLLEERLQRPVQHFAFPFGQPADCGTAAQAVLMRRGYRSAGTTSWGVNRPGVNPYALYRVQLGEERSLAMFAVKLNQLFFSGVSATNTTSSQVFGAERFSALNSETRHGTSHA